jgi:hypothetical protein
MSQPISPNEPAPPVASAKRRSAGVITLIVLGVVLLLCAGGGVSAYFLLRNVDGAGADDPKAAVTDFLTAMYTDQDARKAASLVCSESRDENKITKKVDEIKSSVRKYQNPRFRWDDPKVEQETSQRALVSANVTLSTGDDRVSQQRLSLTVVHKTGWWVCEVEPK